MKNIKEFCSKAKTKIIGVLSAMMVVATTAVTSFASGGEDTFTASEISKVLDPIKSQFTFSNIVAILALVVGAAAVLALGWFGVRKVISIIQRALKKGKVSV